MKRIVSLGILLGLVLSFFAIVANGAVTVRRHQRELAIPLTEVLTSIGLGSEIGNNPRFHIDGRNLVITVDGAGS
jgi:hypothetical protein